MIEQAMKNEAQKSQALQVLGMQLREVEMEEEEFWESFENSRDKAKYDCTVDEIQSTPTYKLSTLQTIRDLMHQGVQIPQELLMYYLDVPEDVKEQWQAINEQQQQMQMQATQMESQAKQEVEALKGKFDLLQQQLVNKGMIDLELLRQQGYDGKDRKDSKDD